MLASTWSVYVRCCWIFSFSFSSFHLLHHFFLFSLWLWIQQNTGYLIKRNFSFIVFLHLLSVTHVYIKEEVEEKEAKEKNWFTNFSTSKKCRKIATRWFYVICTLGFSTYMRHQYIESIKLNHKMHWITMESEQDRKCQTYKRYKSKSIFREVKVLCFIYYTSVYGVIILVDTLIWH